MLALWPAPRTYTGQDVAEIHLVGAVPLVNLVLAHCLGRGARHAEPGEFTLRAFLSGRIDLTRAEAVLGVIEAANPAQLGAALEQLAGGLSGPIVAMRDHLLDVVAHLEANLDFTDEPDVDPLGRDALAAELESSGAALVSLARRLSARETPDGHPRVVLVGPPNVGKSRLFNALLGQDRAIVSSQAGTTRDYLSALCDCDGLATQLVDTAGIEPAGDNITREAQALRGLQIERADLLLVCRSAESAGLPALDLGADHRVLDVWTKGDQAPPPEGQHDRQFLVTSAATGRGLVELRSAIAQALRGGHTEDNCRPEPVHGAGAAWRGPRPPCKPPRQPCAPVQATSWSRSTCDRPSTSLAKSSAQSSPTISSIGSLAGSVSENDDESHGHADRRTEPSRAARCAGRHVPGPATAKEHHPESASH